MRTQARHDFPALSAAIWRVPLKPGPIAAMKWQVRDPALMREELQRWSVHRNKASAGTDWRFTTADARIKLKRLYPSTLME